LLVLFVLVTGPLLSSAIGEEHGCCAGCQQHCCLKPVCRLVCEPKTIVEVVYDCHCEDFCTPGPSKKCGEACEPDCCGNAKKRTLWQPSCGHVRHRHVLVKLEMEREVPHYKCVVEYVCDRCCCQEGRAPCDQASRLGAAAVAMNTAAEKPARVENVNDTSAAEPAPRKLFWPALFGK
jgi:hypothetical protein